MGGMLVVLLVARMVCSQVGEKVALLVDDLAAQMAASKAASKVAKWDEIEVVAMVDSKDETWDDSRAALKADSLVDELAVLLAGL